MLNETFIIRFDSAGHVADKKIVHVPGSTTFFISESDLDNDCKFWVDSSFTVLSSSLGVEDPAIGVYNEDGIITDFGDMTLSGVFGYEIGISRMMQEQIVNNKILADIAFIGMKVNIDNLNVFKTREMRLSECSGYFNEINKYYWCRNWDIEAVKQAVKLDKITAEEFRQITGQNYN